MNDSVRLVASVVLSDDERGVRAAGLMSDGVYDVGYLSLNDDERLELMDIAEDYESSRPRVLFVGHSVLHADVELGAEGVVVGKLPDGKLSVDFRGGVLLELQPSEVVPVTAPNEVVLFDGQTVRWTGSGWECRYGDEWALVVPDSVLDSVIQSDDNCHRLMSGVVEL